MSENRTKALPWPLSNSGYEWYTVFYGRIRTGVIIFSVMDWGRGERDIDLRAEGTMAGRGLTMLCRAGKSKVPVGDECYPNVESAELRWPGFARTLAARGTAVVDPSSPDKRNL